MNYQQAIHKLLTIGQSHLLAHWEALNDTQQRQLLTQIDALDTLLFKHQQQLVLKQSIERSLQDVLPTTAPAAAGNPSDIAIGKSAIAEGLAGCLIVAGGQGTRLRMNGPKGTFPITPLTQKSLFQLFAEKVSAAGRQVNRQLPLAIMTSPCNHAQTIAFFEQHHFFGLHQDQVTFFSQGSLPFLNHSGNLFLESEYTIASGPNGNGLALYHFFHSGTWLKWQQQGIRFLNFLVVDNPLADPYDAGLIGYHQRLHLDVTIKCVTRKNAQEKVGVLACIQGKMAVVEYSELPEPLSTGMLLFPYANISLFCFSMNFVKFIAHQTASLPLHKALKQAPILEQRGASFIQTFSAAWKFEYFIFDILPLAQRVELLLYPRESCFSPLKNYEGDDSVATVRKALQDSDRRTFFTVTGRPCIDEICEVPQDFYYPTQELLNKRGDI